MEAGEFIIFDESHFNPTPGAPAENHFSLNGARGDDVWLVKVDGDGRITEFVDEVHFGAAASDVTLGRSPDGIGPLTSLSRNTMGCGNSHLQLAPVVISEFRYNAGDPSPGQIAIDPTLTADDIEYVELHNATGETIDLAGWRIRGGIDFDFDQGHQIGANEVVLLLPFDPLAPENSARFDALQFEISEPTARFIGGYRGQLSDLGESFRLERPDAPPPDDPSVTPYLTVDKVDYDEHAPWPSAVGAALSRVSPVVSGEHATSWVVSTSPGVATYEDTDFTGDGMTSVGDVDRLLDAIQQAADHSFFDVNRDGAVDEADLSALLATIGSLPGDANLDGSVNALDLNEIGLHWQQPRCMTWSDGDFTGDGMVNATDLNVIGLNWLSTANGQRIAQQQRLPRAPLSAAVDNSAFGAAQFSDVDATQATQDDAQPATTAKSLQDTRSTPTPRRNLRHRRSLTHRTTPIPSSNPPQGESTPSDLDFVFAYKLW